MNFKLRLNCQTDAYSYSGIVWNNIQFHCWVIQADTWSGILQKIRVENNFIYQIWHVELNVELIWPGKNSAYALHEKVFWLLIDLVSLLAVHLLVSWNMYCCVVICFVCWHQSALLNDTVQTVLIIGKLWSRWAKESSLNCWFSFQKLFQIQSFISNDQETFPEVNNHHTVITVTSSWITLLTGWNALYCSFITHAHVSFTRR